MGDHDIKKAFTWRLSLATRISQIQIIAKKATVDVHGCNFLQAHMNMQRDNCSHTDAISFVYVCFMLRSKILYGRGSNVVHSLELGNARALCSGMGHR